VINNGELLVVEKKELLMENFGKKQLVIELRERANEIPHMLHKHNMELTDDGLSISYTYDAKNAESNIQEMLKEFTDSGLLLKDIKINQSSLEDIFVDLVKLK
jgi:ABC-2 type transport system ATP-binding protein